MKDQVLSKEACEAAIERIEMAAEPVANVIKKTNYEGQGESDSGAYLMDMQLAISAMKYVAEFATDKCRFLTY